MTMQASLIRGDDHLQRSYWFSGGLWTILADAQSTGGRYSVLQERLPRGVGAAPHINDGQDETFRVLEGEVTFMIGDEIVQAKAGDFVFIPPDLKHAFRVDSAEALMLNQHAPAGFGTFVTTFGQPARALTMPPADWKDKEITPEQRKALFAEIRQTNIEGPNPLGSPPGN